MSGCATKRATDVGSRNTDELRLPKQLAADPRGPALVARLLEGRRLLWEGGSIRTPVAQLTPELLRVLLSARSAGRLTRGLESATEILAGEERGLRIADQRVSEKGGEPRGERVSRLLILSDDGAERFYRHVESLLRRHGPRILALRLEVTAHDLGEAVMGPNTLARLLLIAHRQAVGDALLSLAPPEPAEI